MPLWLAAAAELRTQLPSDVQATLTRHEEAGTTDTPDYHAAMDLFYARHVCRVQPMPQDVVDSFAQLEAEPTVYHTMNGPSEFHVIGSLKDWSVADRLDDISVPTLVVAGELDEAMPSTWQPFVDRIPDVSSHVFAGASHMPHVEQPDEFNRWSASSSAGTTPARATVPYPARKNEMTTHSSTGQGRPADDLAEFGYKQELNRTLSTADLIIYGLVFMVPIAPWAIFGVVFNEAKGMVPLVYLIGLVAMIFTASSYAQMSRAFPIAGSVYSYVGRGLHPVLGFFAGWTILLDYLLVPTLLYVFAAESMAGIFPGVPKPLWIIVFLAVNTAINYVGISFTAIVNRLFLAAELTFVTIFVVMAIVAISRGVNGAHFTTTPLFNADLFTPQLAAAALSIAVLSFLGFDGIATLSEEAKGGRRSAGIAMISGLLLVALFFVTQTWLAAMLVPGTTTFGDDQVNNAFFSIVGSISNSGWEVAFLAMNALAVGIANAVAAQSATSRLLFSMSRDGRLPRFLSHINPKTKAPERAILVVAGLTLVAGLFFVGQINVISTLVNFGALTSFLLLHVSVIAYFGVRRKSGNVLLHWIAPVLGFLIIGFVLWNADPAAKIGGVIWLAIGALVLLYYRSKGTGVGAEHAAADPFQEVTL